MKLTGKTRYRIQFLTRKLILQVEYKYIHSVMCGSLFDSYYVCEWRDATFADIQELKGDNKWI